MDIDRMADEVANAVEAVLARQTDAAEVVCLPVVAWSMAVLVATFIVARHKRTPLGPATGKVFNHATLTGGVFLSVLLFSFSLSTHGELPWPTRAIAKAIDSLQTMLPSRTAVPISATNVQDCLDFVVFYEYLLYLVAPVTTFFDVVTLFRGTTSRLRALWRSLWRDTYLITPLNEQTLALAESIRKKHRRDGGDQGYTRKANIVFTDLHGAKTTTLANRAYDMDAICVSRSAEETLGGIWRQHRVRVLFDGGDVSEIARATAMFDSESRRGLGHELCLYLFSPLVSAQEMLPSQGVGGTVCLRRVDWTRNLVESTLERLPLFLLNPPPQAASANAGELQREMLLSPSRRIVIVGAGHVGTEFLKMALVYGCVTGMRFAFDVIDSAPDPADERQCVAKSLLRASAPELLDKEGKSATGARVSFLCMDVRSEAYEAYLVKNASTITYAFVALGDDATTADTAMRTRKMLERGILEHCMATHATKGLDGQRRAYGNRCRPVIVAVIDDDDLGGTLCAAMSKDVSQRIEVVGSRRSMFSFESMLLADQRETDYQSRSAHSSREHAKYKVFAYARRRYAQGDSRDDAEPDWERVDWRRDFRATVARADKGDPTWQAIGAYNDYCTSTKALACVDEPDHEWLLRMEHDRWCAFARAEGFRQPTGDEARVYMSVFPDDVSPYRSNETGLHARLVPFDELDDLGQLVEDETGQTHNFQQRHDEHIRVQKRNPSEPAGKSEARARRPKGA